MNEPSPGEIKERFAELDARPMELEDLPAWFDEATERTILQLFLIRQCLAQGSYEYALKMLMNIPNMAQHIAMNALSALPHDRVVEMVKDKLEIAMQHPMAVDHEMDGFVAFRFDYPEVPDTYE
jgi:hypothetical protein